MKKDTYHHGNLQAELIEAGLALIHEEGKGNFSLRKLAKNIGVSPTACYNHFEGIDELLNAMKVYVTGKFCNALLEGAAVGTKENATTNMGKAYVNFFAKNPHYFSFIYENDDYNIELSETDFCGDFEPFNIFKEISIQCMEANHLSKEHLNDNLTVMWATVHGLAAMANMKGFHYAGDWNLLTEKILINKLNMN